MLLPAEALIERARQGDTLTPKDRRYCVSHIMMTYPAMSNGEIGQIFRVTEKVIRSDKLKIRRERVRNLKDDDPGLIISDIVANADRLNRDLEVSKSKAKLGTSTYLSHCLAQLRVMNDTVKLLMDCGYITKNLGNMTVDKYEYVAEVREGTVVTLPAHMRDKEKNKPASVEIQVSQSPTPLLLPAIEDFENDETADSADEEE